MASLREALAAQKPARSLLCHLCEAMESMAKDDRDAIQDALDDPRMRGTMIARALEATGYNVTVGSVRRHRRSECAAKGVG